VNEFPRTLVGGISLPRLICGSNWMLGFSHSSAAKDKFIKELFDKPSKLVPVIEAFARRGCNAYMSMGTRFNADAVHESEQRSGTSITWIATPGYAERSNPDSWKKSAEEAKRLGATFCFPHQSVTDKLLDGVNRALAPRLIDHLRVVREMGMIPGLSAHAPEAVLYADACGADVESYIQPYNAAGFLCQVETDWLQNVFHKAKKPVMTIKPLAAGRLLPPTGLAFVWNTLRDCDMVTIGTISPYEAEEDIELSLAILERRKAQVELQYTRSKADFVQKAK